VATLLIEDEGAKVDSKNAKKATPLSLAAGKGREDLVGMLLAHGADPITDESWSGKPLARAAKEGHLGVVQMLIDNGVDTGSTSPDIRESLLSLAAGNGHIRVFEFLLTRGANPN
jgi:serine/threonine-protein phosphatase 6 regulatory ankyrin repeat subunit B